MSKYEALDRLEEIQEQLEELGREAAMIFQENFPSQYQTGDAYGAFTFGSSWNSYNTTLETLIESARRGEEDYA
ncbi:MAG: hypothetical protein VW498_03335 [Candidatus Thalassarchaeaceae archaeon]|jgi:hypothetical protein